MFRLALVVLAAFLIAPEAIAQTTCPPQPTTRVLLLDNRVSACNTSQDADTIELEVTSQAGTRAVPAVAAPAFNAKVDVALGTVAQVCGEGSVKARACRVDALEAGDTNVCGAWGSPLLGEFQGCPPPTAPRLSKPVP